MSHNKRNNERGWTSSVEKYKDCLFPCRLSVEEYMENMRRSFVAINTPAVVSCHGWKLAEYLALGKCIVSVPLVNDLPYPLEHGANVHFVDGDAKSVMEAVKYIYEHPNYRQKLERGARAYFEKYCAPEQTIRLLVQNVGIETSKNWAEKVL